jgi:hypothetical protein
MYMTNRKVEDIVMQVGLPLNITRTLRPFQFSIHLMQFGNILQYENYEAKV